GHKSPHQQLHKGPEKQLKRPNRVLCVEQDVAGDQRANDGESEHGECGGRWSGQGFQASGAPVCGLWPRAILMKTSSRSSSSKCRMISPGVPSARIRPSWRKSTRSQTSSMSRMLWDV